MLLLKAIVNKLLWGEGGEGKVGNFYTEIILSKRQGRGLEDGKL